MHETHSILRVPVGFEYALRVSCSCGWRGPTRSLDEPARVWRTLLDDDADWHLEMVAG